MLGNLKSVPKIPKNIDEYIASCSMEVQPILERIRATVNKAPDATEKISYRIPIFSTEEGGLVYFAAFKAHIGLLPACSRGCRADERSGRYMGPKGNLRFPLAERIPYGLITRIAETFATRIAWAAGYFVEPNYFLPSEKPFGIPSILFITFCGLDARDIRNEVYSPWCGWDSGNS